MPFYTDQLGKTIELKQTPKRIVSLVPSQTELFFDLGLEEEVVGITKFCVHPVDWFRKKTRVGGTKQLNMEKIRSLQPDLVIANKEENRRDQIEELARNFPVWTSEVHDLDSACEMILSLGKLMGKPERAGEIARMIQANFSELSRVQHSPTPLRTAYLIWREPYMTAGGDTFIHDMMQRAGFHNLFEDHNRYPETTIEELRDMHCELLLFSSEPFPFAQKHIDAVQALLPNTKMILVDGELFSWYGSRLLKAPAYFKELQLQVLSLAHAGNR